MNQAQRLQLYGNYVWFRYAVEEEDGDDGRMMERRCSEGPR